MIEKRERWMQLAAMAAEEQDPVKLMELVGELNILLDDKMGPPNRGRTVSTSPENINSEEDRKRRPTSEENQ